MQSKVVGEMAGTSKGLGMRDEEGISVLNGTTNEERMGVKAS
jgi:hypothetical protein